ncbi:MAG: hypothetical protein GY759_05315 [Chloroflexi bacterium]|nr:hypothetical protein [Chloroflexota bacterium]
MPTTNQYLYRIQPVRPTMLSEGATEEESAVVSQHFRYLKQLADQGVVLLAGRTLMDSYSDFGIVIFIAESDEAAQTVVQNDPAVIKRVMRAELYPYRIAVTGGILRPEH